MSRLLDGVCVYEDSSSWGDRDAAGAFEVASQELDHSAAAPWRGFHGP